jgi:hypothetical protein
MARLFWFTWLAATLAQAQQEQLNASVIYDTSPRAISDSQLTVAVIPVVPHPDSPLLNIAQTDPPQPISRRGTPIDVTFAAGTAAGTAILVGLAAYDLIASKIKDLSNDNSWTLTQGTVWDDKHYLGYAYHATTTGSRYDTTAELKTIQHAVAECAEDLHKAGVVVGCCNFRHGRHGTWHGHLQLSADPKFPAKNAKCPA